MAKAMNLEVGEMPANEELENQLTELKNFAIMAFENPGLCHIGEEIFKNLDIQTKLNGRLVRKSWNDMFEKQASKIDLKNMPIVRKFMKEKPLWETWRKFLKAPKTEIPTLVLNFYLQDLFNRMMSNSAHEDDKRTPLLPFARVGNSKMIDFILQMKTNTNKYWKIHERETALNIASKYGHVNVAKVLISYRNYKAILNATLYGRLEVLKVLIDDDPDPMDVVKRFVNEAIIRHAACRGKVEVLRFFEERCKKHWLEYALTTRMAANFMKETIHEIADKGHLEMLIYLSQKAPYRNPVQKDSLGWTPIHYAAQKGHLEIVKFLASYTSDPNDADKEGLTPIHCAAYGGHLKIVKFLALHTSSPNVADKNGKTPSQIARSKGYLDIAAFFLELEAKERTGSEMSFQKSSQDHQEK